MKVLFFCFIVVLMFSYDGKTQNLVKNPSFEEFWNLPTRNLMNIMNAEYWQSYATTPDYYNSDFKGMVSLPKNWMGMAMPFEGKACIGMIALSKDGQYEQILGQLEFPLLKDGEYYVSFKVCFAHYGSRYCSYLFGADFINGGLLSANSGITNYTSLGRKPVMNNIQGNFIYEPEIWHTISDTIIAKGGETSIIIGTFYIKDTLFENALEQHKLKIKMKDKKYMKKFGYHIRSYILHFYENTLLIKNPYFNVDSVLLFYPEIEREDMEDYLNWAYYYFDYVEVIPVNATIEDVKQQMIHADSINNLLNDMELGDSMILSNIYFDDRLNFSLDEKKSSSELYVLVEYMRNNPNSKFEIISHVFSEDNSSTNKRTSDLRARNIHKYFINHAIEEKRIVNTGMGDLMPLVDDTIKNSPEINNRIEIKLITK
jgi:outer membrane protein OmpA-like peptidoglycan-associated protein